MSLVEITCPLCGSADHRLLFQISDRDGVTDHVFNLVECRSCSLTYVNPRPTGEELADYYPAVYYGVNSTAVMSRVSGLCRSWVQSRRVKQIGKHGQVGRALDIGCGTGDLLLTLQKKGWETYGVETSENGAKIARKRLGQQIYNKELVECHFPDEHFDLIVLWHVLEHLLEPKRDLAEIRRVLKKDGGLVLALPNADSLLARFCRRHWYHWDVPRHLCHYSPKTLNRLLHEAGFAISYHWSPGLDFPPSSYYSLLIALSRICPLRMYFQANHSPFAKTLYLLLLGITGPVLLACDKLLNLCGQGDRMEVRCRKKD